MTQRLFIPALILALTCIAGCHDSPTTNSDPAEDSPRLAATETENFVKVSVMVDGTVLVNSEAVPVDSFSTKLDSLGDITGVWYYGEAPDADDPHENAMTVIIEISNRKLPITMYMDDEFTQRAKFDEE